MNFYRKYLLKLIFVTFGSIKHFLFFILLTFITTMFDFLILLLLSVYILRQLSFDENVPNSDFLSTTTHLPIDTLLDNFLILIFIRFLLIFFRIFYEYYLRIQFTQAIRNQNFIINSSLDVYSKIIKSPIANFTSRVSSWQLGANGLFNAMTSIFSSVTALIIAPLWIFKITDAYVTIILFLIFIVAAFLVSIFKYLSLRSYKIGVKTDVKAIDKCLYLYNDWRFLKSLLNIDIIIKKTKTLFLLYSKQMAQSEAFILLIRPVLEILFILTISMFFILNSYGYGLGLEQSLQLALITLRLVPAVSGTIAGYTGIANNLVYYDHIMEFDKNVEDNKINDTNMKSFNIFKVDYFSIIVNKPISIKFSTDKRNKNTKILNVTGAEGSGKSVICDILSGQLSWSGQIIFNDIKIEINNQYTNIFNAIYLTQSTNVHKHTLNEYLGPKKIWIKIPVIKKVLELFDFVNSLEDNDYIGTDDRSLSGGQTQVIRLIKALNAIETEKKLRKIIIIDEGLSGIPDKKRAKLIKILTTFGYKLIYISHNLNDFIPNSKKLSPDN